MAVRGDRIAIKFLRSLKTVTCWVLSFTPGQFFRRPVQKCGFVDEGAVTRTLANVEGLISTSASVMSLQYFAVTYEMRQCIYIYNIFAIFWMQFVVSISIFEFIGAYWFGFIEMRAFWSSLYALRKLGPTWKLRLVRWWRCPQLRRATSDLWRLCVQKGWEWMRRGTFSEYTINTTLIYYDNMYIINVSIL